MGRKFDGAVVVVTGASGGIGRATGLAFAEQGARLVLAARRADALEELARQCQATGGQALAVPAGGNPTRGLPASAGDQLLRLRPRARAVLARFRDRATAC